MTSYMIKHSERMPKKQKFPKNFWAGLPDMAIFENWVR